MAPQVCGSRCPVVRYAVGGGGTSVGGGGGTSVGGGGTSVVVGGGTSVGGGGEPLVGWVELEVVDLRFGLKAYSGFLEGVDVPDIDSAIFASGGDILAGWGN